MKGLVDIPDPMPAVFERRELRRVIVRCPQHFQVGRDGREEAFRHPGALAHRDRLNRPGYVDEVLHRSLPGMIGPRTRVREGVEVGSRRISRMTSFRAVSLSSWKAIWQMTRWPRSPQAPTGDADPMKAKETTRQARWRNALEYAKADPPTGAGSSPVLGL